MRERRNEEIVDEFGPGSDLAFSLAALALLLLGVTGVGVRAPTSCEAPKPEQCQPVTTTTIDPVIMADLESRNARLEGEVKKLRAGDESRKPLILQTSEPLGGARFFTGDGRSVSPSGKSALQRAVRDNRGLLARSNANVLMVMGHSRLAPQPPAADCKTEACDATLDLSLARALSAAHALAAIGIPAECVAPTGFGRFRSSQLRAYFDESPGFAFAIFDRRYTKDLGLPDTSRKEEDRIELRAATDEENFFCTNEKLLQAIDRLN
jgi:hypothetical protein